MTFDIDCVDIEIAVDFSFSDIHLHSSTGGIFIIVLVAYVLQAIARFAPFLSFAPPPIIASSLGILNGIYNYTSDNIEKMEQRFNFSNITFLFFCVKRSVVI